MRLFLTATLATILFLSASLINGCKKKSVDLSIDAVSQENAGVKQSPPAEEGKKKKKKKFRTGKKKHKGKGKAGPTSQAAKAEASGDGAQPRLSAVAGSAEGGPEAASARKTHSAVPHRLVSPEGPADLASKVTAAGEALAQAPPAAKKPESSATPATPSAKSAAPAGPDASGNPSPPPLHPPAGVPAPRLLTVNDLNQQLEVKGWISYGPVPGIVPTQTFNSVIYRKPGENAFVSLLVWDFDQYAQALEKWNEMFATWPNAQEQQNLFTKFIFFSYRNQVSSLVFMEPNHSMVLALSCHSRVCDDTRLLNLARSVFNRAR